MKGSTHLKSSHPPSARQGLGDRRRGGTRRPEAHGVNFSPRSPPTPLTRSPKAGPTCSLNQGAEAHTPFSPRPARRGRRPGCQARRTEKAGVPSRCPGPLSRPARAGMWPSRSLAAPGAATPKREGGGSPLPGLSRLLGDDNFPATGSSWPGSRRAPAPGSPRWPRRPDGRVAAPTARRSGPARLAVVPGEPAAGGMGREGA